MNRDTAIAKHRQEQRPGTRDAATIIAISIVAFAIANVLHEGAGHGGACLLYGGQAKVLSTVHFECSFDSRFVAAGGTLVNFVAGFLAWLALRLAARASGSLRFFLWLLMTVNLMAAAGYFLFSGIGNIGDWADVVRGLQPTWAWRVALTVLGAASYSAVVWLALHELRPLLGPRDLRRGGAKDLTVLPYLTGGVLFTIAGLLNPVGMILVAISAAASSFGGTSGLAWMTQYLRPGATNGTATAFITLTRSGRWIFVAAIVAGLFIGVLGRGISF